ncbi:MAG: wax ester/triacylglycerol synthase domain-containing protein [Acidimicrobiia bacterium]
MPRPQDVERFEAHMSDSDALMWNIEKDPLLRSTIVTVLFFDRVPDWDTLVARVERGSWLIPRMRQRVATPLLRVGPPHWSGDPHFDLLYHLRRVRVCEPTEDAVLDLARTAAMAGFDRSRPLWEYTLVDGLEGGRAAMVLKVHHSMTDGVGGMKLLLMLFDFERDAAEPAPLDGVEAIPTFTATDLVLKSLGHRRRRAIGMARRAVVDVAKGTSALVRHPRETVGHAAEVGSSVARFLAPATTPHSHIMRARTLARSLGVFDVPLDDLKRAGKAVGGSLNDAFVAGVVGGLAQYHEFHGEHVDDLRMVMSINLRETGAALGGNHFTPARFLVPMTIKDPAERMVELGRLARSIRDEPAVALTDALSGILNQLPTTVTTAIFGSMLKGADFVTSNVPGAPFPIYAAGAELERMYAFAPLSGTAANVTLLSHCGTCCIGVNVDSVAVPDRDVLIRCLEQSFADVVGVGAP